MRDTLITLAEIMWMVVFIVTATVAHITDDMNMLVTSMVGFMIASKPEREV